MPATVMKPTTKALEQWIDKNPLRRWRVRSGLEWAEVTAQLGVGTTAVKYWEWGATRPSPDNMQRISDVIGIDADRAWTRWLNARPQ